jgi:hypothetical protein
MTEVYITPDPQTRKQKIYCKQELIIQSLQQFYMNRSDLKEILQIIESETNISLRLIDWFVTNYARYHNISYILKGNEFFVYLDYKNQLKAYSKKLFDPFCRRERIMFQLSDIPAFITTVGKLNFFRWAIEKGVIDYIKLNLTTIEKEMNESARELQKIRKSETKSNTNISAKRITRRKVVSENVSTKQMQKHFNPIEISFD